MTKLLLVRHGEPDYSMVAARGFKGYGKDLAQLTALGIEQAREVAKDSRLKGAEIIVASPYTRAMQTAAIISKELQLDIHVEVDIHEWIPDLTFGFIDDEYVQKAAKECTKYKGDYPDDDKRNWEKLSTVADRGINCIKKYLNYEKIIIVSHGVLMRQFKYEKEIPYCGILEVDFDENFKWGGWIEH